MTKPKQVWALIVVDQGDRSIVIFEKSTKPRHRISVVYGGHNEQLILHDQVSWNPPILRRRRIVDAAEAARAYAKLTGVVDGFPLQAL